MKNEIENRAEYLGIEKLKELPQNPRKITKDQFEILKTSIQNNPDYFEARPLIASDRTGELVVLAGNQRLKAARALGLTEVPVVVLHGLTEEREREIIIRDNVENGEWDFNELANGWSAGQLKDWGMKLGYVDWDEIPDISTLQLKELPKEQIIICPKCGYKGCLGNFKKE